MNVLSITTAAVAPMPPVRRRLPAIFRASFWIQADPNPEYSRLDRLDGLGRAS